MSLLRRTISCILTAIIFFTLILNTDLIYAEDIYPLEAGEKLLEEIAFDEEHTEIYTQLEDSYYLLSLEKNNGKWVIESKKEIHPKWTGLKENEVEYNGNRMLSAAIEDRLDSYGLAAASLPPVVDYSYTGMLPPVGEQYENSCVGWATGYYLRTFQQAKDMEWSIIENGTAVSSRIFSPSFIYNKIRKPEGNDPDGGSDINDAAVLLKSIGAATLDSFPYVPKDIFTLPSEEVIQGAYSNRVKSWALLCSDLDSNQYIIQKTKEYLNTGDLVVAGSRIGFKFSENTYRDQNGNHVITSEYNPRYLHAYVIVGYDDTIVSPDGLGAFKMINSWGTEWGDRGFSYISYQAYADNLREAYVFTDLINEGPQELETSMNDNVVFNMEFAGEGRYDIKISDSKENLVYEQNDLKGIAGLNSIIWNGRNLSGDIAPDGVYKLNIIPYKGTTPKPAFNITFNKSGMARSTGAVAFYHNCKVEYVDVPVIINSDAMLNIKVAYNDSTYMLKQDQIVRAGEIKAYRILNSEFDFSNKELDKIRIMVDVKPFNNSAANPPGAN